MTTIAVITCAIPERLDLLAEALASVRAQTRPPEEHLVCIDYAYRGTAPTLNRALAGVTSEWVAVLGDDDILYPRHLEALEAACDGADVVYSRCDADFEIPNVDADFHPKLLRHGNYIPATALIRTEAVRAEGGWPDEFVEDHALWIRFLDAERVFRKVDEITWHYRMHGRPQKTFGGLT